MMREDEIFAASVDVESVSEIFHRHGGALDVPAGAAGADLGVPECLAGFGSLPEGEVASLFFAEAVGINARAVFNVGEILLGKLAVLGELGDAEVIGAVFSPVSYALLKKAIDEVCHLVHVLGGSGNGFRALNAENGGVFEEEVLKLLGILADADAKLGGVGDDAIVDVSDVHDVLEAVSAHAKPATQDIDGNEGPEIADVGEVVDRGAAVVHADG